MIELNGFYNMDCMEGMKQFPDKYFELAIVDPQYGVSYARGKNGWGVCENRPDRKDVSWDKKPPEKKLFHRQNPSFKMLDSLGQNLRYTKQERFCRCRISMDFIPQSCKNV